jgi:hypothetical protein
MLINKSMNKDQQFLQEAYKRVKISEQEDLALAISSGTDLKDFLKNFEGMTLKQFKDKESYYSLYQLNKHNGYADSETPEGLLTDLIFTLGHILNENMFLKEMRKVREELNKKYKRDEVEAQRRELQSAIFRIKYDKDLSEEEKKEKLKEAEQAYKDFEDSGAMNVYSQYRDEENQAMKELDSQKITSSDLFPSEDWSSESQENFVKLQEIFKKLSQIS